jgi:DNA-binding LacI/PurR family transcriptional regulator
MRDIATKAGVTHATVSMSLANNPSIPPATRNRIKALAETMGYQPNPYLSTLMRLRSQRKGLDERPVIALVCAYDRADGWRRAGPTIRQMREGAIERAALRGYKAQEFWLHQSGMSNTRFSDMLRARGIEGLLLGPLANNAQPPVLKWPDFSIVSLSVPLPSLTITTVSNDHYFSSLQTVRECHRLGYRRPGLIILKSQHGRMQGRWEAAFMIEQKFLPGLSPTQQLLVDDDWKDFALLRLWLKDEKPDVIITSIGERVFSILQKNGWRIPEDIGLANLACPEPGQRISGCYQNGKLAGATAMDALISMIERHEKGLPEQSVTLMIESLWNPGKTLRQVAQSPVRRD